LHGREVAWIAPFPLLGSGDPDASGHGRGGEAVDAAQGDGGLDPLAMETARAQARADQRLWARRWSLAHSGRIRPVIPICSAQGSGASADCLVSCCEAICSALPCRSC
jgi:hypothetical protein